MRWHPLVPDEDFVPFGTLTFVTGDTVTVITIDNFFRNTCLFLVEGGIPKGITPDGKEPLLAKFVDTFCVPTKTIARFYLSDLEYHAVEHAEFGVISQAD